MERKWLSEGDGLACSPLEVHCFAVLIRDAKVEGEKVEKGYIQNTLVSKVKLCQFEMDEMGVWLRKGGRCLQRGLIC